MEVGWWADVRLRRITNYTLGRLLPSIIGEVFHLLYSSTGLRLAICPLVCRLPLSLFLSFLSLLLYYEYYTDQSYKSINQKKVQVSILYTHTKDCPSTGWSLHLTVYRTCTRQCTVQARYKLGIYNTGRDVANSTCMQVLLVKVL